MIENADLVFVMEPLHINRIREEAGDRLARKCINLDILDTYTENDPDLIAILKAKVPHYIQGALR